MIKFTTLSLLTLPWVAMPVWAQVFTVNQTADTGSSGTLRWAIGQANSYAGAASIQFNLPGGGTILLNNALPILQNVNGVSIDGANGGQGPVIIDGGSSSATTGDRIFFLGVRAGDNTGVAATTSTTWSIANLTLQNGNARGGAGGAGNFAGAGAGAGLGGAVFVNAGSLALNGVNFGGNRATGGSGGGLSGPEGGSGGGGGMGGNGGAGSSYNSGGGGGFGRGADGGAGTVNGSPGLFTGGAAAGTGYGAGSGVGGLTGGGGGGSGSNQNGGGGGPGGVAGGDSTGGVGGFGGGGGGGGGNAAQNGGAGGFGGGGGGGAVGDGAAGGFGGGGGGGRASSPGGFGGGTGASVYGGGGGGAGLGGAVFVRQGATIAITDGSLGSGVATGGGGAAGGTAGQGIGTGMFLAGSANYTVSLANTITITDTIGGGVDAQITGGLQKSGPGTLVLGGANTYIGGTVVNAGRLVASHASAVGTSGVSLEGGTFEVASGVTVGNTVSFGAGGGVLTGRGVLTTGVTVGAGAVIAPGNSPGTLTTGSETWAGGGTYRWEINHAESGVGTDPGADALSILGSLSITATSGSPFTIEIDSLTPANAAGPVDNFSPASSQSWFITTASGGISGFDAGSFQLDTSGFANSLAGGVFTLGQLGNSLVLTFNPAGFVPEAGTVGAVAMLASLVGCGWVRRRRST